MAPTDLLDDKKNLTVSRGAPTDLLDVYMCCSADLDGVLLGGAFSFA